jgi:glycosyltransferase involved in cell wall biosynthesis
VLAVSVALDVGPLRDHPAGVGVYVRSLAQALYDLPYANLTFVGRRIDSVGLSDAVPSLVRSGRLPYPAWVQLFAERDTARSGASLAHFTDGLVPLFRGRRTVLTIHDLSLVRHWRSHRLIRYARIPLILLAPRLADRVIAVSRATADEVISLTGTSPRKIEIIPLAARESATPADPEVVTAVRARYGLGTRPYLLVPGTLEPRKNHLRVIAAFDAVLRRSPAVSDLQLVLAGQPGWRAAAIGQAVASSPNREHIRLLGYVPDEDLAALMTGSQAVVYASLYEGFGLPVVEAMACGAPVVTSNVSSMPEVAGDAGILVDPVDVASIARGIDEVLHADASVRAGSLARAATFSWIATARATVEVYEGRS